jgi:hypothetical protein
VQKIFVTCVSVVAWCTSDRPGQILLRWTLASAVATQETEAVSWEGATDSNEDCCCSELYSTWKRWTVLFR